MSVDSEVWRDIPGYENLYQVSNLGRVKSLPRKVRTISRNGIRGWRIFPGRILKLMVYHFGHLYVELSKEGKIARYSAHVLVLTTFVGPCPEGMVCRHFPDKDPANNRLDNIKWGTREENEADKLFHGTDNRAENIRGVNRWTGIGCRKKEAL